MTPVQRCALCGRTGLDVESRIVADESPLGYHREPRCVDVGTACGERVGVVDPTMARWAAWIEEVGRIMPGDWACAECKPTSDILVDGFRCVYHEAAAFLSSVERAAKRETT